MIGKIYVNMVYGRHRSAVLDIRYALLFTTYTALMACLYTGVTEFWHVANSSEWERMSMSEVAGYRALDEKQDLYRYVGQIKHGFAYEGDMGRVKKEYRKKAGEYLDHEFLRIVKEHYGPTGEEPDI